MKTSTSVAVDIRYLPPYAPDLNPTEQVWKAAKIDLLGNYVPTDFEALEWRLDESLALIGETPELLRNFVKWAGFELDESHWI